MPVENRLTDGFPRGSINPIVQPPSAGPTGGINSKWIREVDFSTLKKLIIVDNPLLKDRFGEIKYRVGTFFPEGAAGTILTGPTIHAMLKLYHVDMLNEERAAKGQAPLDNEEILRVLSDAVDLIMDNSAVYIRPNVRDMSRTFRADAYIRKLGVPRHLVRFIEIRKAEARNAVKSRGESWRAQEIPKSAEEIREFIIASRITLGTRAVYYFSHATGIKYMTFSQFAEIGRLPAPDVRACLSEIKELSGQKSEDGTAIISFFKSEGFGNYNFEIFDFDDADDGQVIKHYNALKLSFFHSTKQGFTEDNLDDPVWLAAMFERLMGRGGAEKTELEEEALGLSREFHSRVAWLPGGTVTGGRLVPDEVFDPGHQYPDDSAQRLLDRRVIAMAENFIKDVPDIEYINIGRVESSLSKRRSRKIIMPGRRAVYVAVYKARGSAEESVKFIRFQKSDVSYFLDMGYDIAGAENAAALYGASVIRRFEACRRLGLNSLPTEIKSIREVYYGANLKYRGFEITSGYFLRDYAFGYATDKIPPRKYRSADFTGAFGTLLGRAAAASIILGRLHEGEVLFDDGDEVVLLDSGGVPADIVVTDITSAFNDVEIPLAEFAGDFALPISSRTGSVPDIELFKTRYIGEFSRRFSEIRDDYMRNKDAYLGMFRDDDHDADFYGRWTSSLERLENTDVDELVEIMEKFSSSPGS